MRTSVVVANELQVAAFRRANDAAGGFDRGEQLVERGALRGLSRREPRLVLALRRHRLGQVFGDAGDHLRELDLGGDVVNEIDQHREIDQHQTEGGRDRDMGDELAPIGGSDRYQHHDAIHERCHERSQRELGAAVADEIAQHPRTKLRRRQRQRHDRDGKDDADDGDHRRCNRGQDLTRRVGGAADHARWRPEPAVVSGSVQPQGEPEKARAHRKSESSEPTTNWCAALLAATVATPHQGVASHQCSRPPNEHVAFTTTADI